MNITQFQQETSLEKREVDLIICHVLKISTAQLMIYDKTVSQKQAETIQKYIKEREKGKPFAYIVGKKAFWTLDLLVNEHTLIPRPETEQIIEIVLQKVTKTFAGKILDLGTGTGAIALALGSELEHAAIVAIDFCQQCLKIAKQNQQAWHIKNVEFYQSNWFSGIKPQQKFEFIVTNPPYIAQNDRHLAALKHEPITALVAKNQGLADIYHIISNAKEHLSEKGWLIIEHGYNQHQEIRRFFKHKGYKNVKTYKDIAENPRITLAQWQNLAIDK